jgi:hypothetical protein
MCPNPRVPDPEGKVPTLGDGARALDAFDRAIRLNPADDVTVWMRCRGNFVR